MPLSQISNAPTPNYDWKAGPPPDQDQLSSDLHCIHLSVDGLVYVCDIGSPGRMAGQFHWLDAIAMDLLGHIYTGEVDDGKRVQKFVLLNGDGVRRFRPHD